MNALDMDGLKALAAEHEAGVHYSSTVPEYAAMVALLNAAPALVAKVAAYESVLAEVRAHCVTQRDAIRATYDPSVTPYHYYADACDDVLAILDQPLDPAEYLWHGYVEGTAADVDVLAEARCNCGFGGVHEPLNKRCALNGHDVIAEVRAVAKQYADASASLGGAINAGMLEILALIDSEAGR